MKAFSIEELRSAAKRRLPRAVFDFIDGGAEDELTLRANREAFGKVKLQRRVLVDVSNVNTETTILGVPAKLPIAIAPTGAVGFGWRGGDVMVARVAAAAGIPFTLSTSATASIERIAEEAPGRHWFQLYLFKDGSRKGPDAPLMHLPVAQLTDEDILNISAYVGSLAP